MSAGRDDEFDIVPLDTVPTGGTDEDVLPVVRPAPRWLRRLRPRTRGTRLAWVAAGLAVVAGAVTVTQLGDGGSPPAHRAILRPTPSPAPTPTATATATAGAYAATLSDIAGDRCPSGISCGVSASVSPGMSSALYADFAVARIDLRVSAYDADRLTVYWQQIEARTGSGVAIVVSEQRIAGPPASRPIQVIEDAPHLFVSVVAQRGSWRLTVELVSMAPGRALPISSARRWVSTAPVPA